MLKGKFIVLRDLQNSDIDFLEYIENNQQNWQYGSERKKYTKQDLVSYIANATTDITLANQYRFVIDLKKIPIGFIDLFDYTKKNAQVGVIIDSDYRKRGYAKEALTLLIEYAFFVLNIEQLHAVVEKNNLASIQLFHSCRFTLERETSELQYFVKLAKN